MLGRMEQAYVLGIGLSCMPLFPSLFIRYFFSLLDQTFVRLDVGMVVSSGPNPKLSDPIQFRWSGSNE